MSGKGLPAPPQPSPPPPPPFSADVSAANASTNASANASASGVVDWATPSRLLPPFIKPRTSSLRASTSASFLRQSTNAANDVASQPNPSEWSLSSFMDDLKRFFPVASPSASSLGTAEDHPPANQVRRTPSRRATFSGFASETIPSSTSAPPESAGGARDDPFTRLFLPLWQSIPSDWTPPVPLPAPKWPPTLINLFDTASAAQPPLPAPSATASTTSPSPPTVSFPWAIQPRKKPNDTTACTHRHPFGFLRGDVVIVPGFLGSHLQHRVTMTRTWLSFEAVWAGAGKSDVRLPKEANGADADDDVHTPTGIIDSIGPFNICSDLLREMTALQECTNRELRLHKFPYDWRRELQHSSDALEKFVEEIVQKNGGKPVTVIAHSMGGLVTIRAVNRRPELFKGVVFEGTPFGAVPTVLWAFNRGAFFLPNADLFGPSVMFHCRSAYAFLPRDGRGLSSSNGIDIHLDYFNPAVWHRHKLSPDLAVPAASAAASATATAASSAADAPSATAASAYLAAALTAASDFHQSIAFSPNVPYPPFAVVRGKRWSTPVKFATSLEVKQDAAAAAGGSGKDAESVATAPAKAPDASAAETATKPAVWVTEPSAAGFGAAAGSASTDPGGSASTSGTERGAAEQADDGGGAGGDDKSRITVYLPSQFGPGDGLVPADSTDMPSGYKFHVVETSANHIWMMNDLEALGTALECLEGKDGEGNGEGVGLKE
ncbi:hypothetical protein DFJ73DRAFT_964236 [Zopfochytrium polystomum]|nr:hypothetical protein DFJ73DRAFT_964236 [Zopfochytrium polystomum]